MSMRSFISKIAVAAAIAAAGTPQAAASGLIPSHAVLQSGGGMGIVSAGTGWSYGKGDKWETDISVGIVPKYDSNSCKAVLALKENFVPWNFRINDRFSFQPLTASLYFTTIASSRFWLKQPDRYAAGYYLLPTKIRTNISIGERFTWHFRGYRGRRQSLTAFYEFGSCDIYVLSAFGNSSLRVSDILQLTIGLRFNFR